ncbi:hypothetical protein [Zunongwangia pacifica]|uniref:Uncharacterized protein n=1 Tax=Zunongwangia pacifica TaxID=2911062 RepID=A0A9X1ZTZ2_9FLAO|nr:hypothetical protein [Zunongwangia pacifica]MCL6220992.1 hypothetical protein [Zunongwangia pacifica]
MKTKKLDQLKLIQLKRIGTTEYGLKKEETKRHTFRNATVRFEDYTDYIMRITSLLEVCVLALDGEGDFHSKNLSHQSKTSSVQLVIEMVIELMPDGDMFQLEQIIAILENDTDYIHFPKKLKKEILKNQERYEKGKTHQ